MSMTAVDPRYELYDDLVAQLAWRDSAACLDSDLELFFPTRGESCEEAKAICAVCSVITECAEFAITRVVREGVYGGLSERQRRHERHRRHCDDATCTNIAHREVEDPAPDWVPELYRALWKRKRSPRRATFGDGSLRARAIARSLRSAAVAS